MTKLEQLLESKNPKQAIERMLQEFEQKMKALLEEARNTNQGNDFFEDLDSMKKIAEKTTDEKIKEFKQLISERMNFLLEKIQQENQTLLTQVNNEADLKYKLIITECEKLISQTIKEQDSSLRVAQKQALNDALTKLATLKGEKGDRGANGVPGKDGIGLRGQDGKDGSPDTPDQVVEKINSSSNLISINKINGLIEEISNIKKVAQQGGGKMGGGGMGNWVHQSFDLSTSTTSITLTYRPAANGYAHMIRYQGQMLALNTQYSISGKVVTLLFTPDNYTTLDITYVRA